MRLQNLVDHKVRLAITCVSSNSEIIWVVKLACLPSKETSTSAPFMVVAGPLSLDPCDLWLADRRRDERLQRRRRRRRKGKEKSREAKGVDFIALEKSFFLFHPADPRGITQGGLPGIPTQLWHLSQVDAKGFSDHKFHARSAYTAQLLTLHQPKANNQYRTANQI